METPKSAWSLSERDPAARSTEKLAHHSAFDLDQGQEARQHARGTVDGRRRRRIIIIAACAAALVVVLAVVIPVAVVFGQRSGSKHSSRGSNGNASNSSKPPPNSNLHNISDSSVPDWARGGYLDPFSWYDTLDFNVTFTDAQVGGLYVMGLNETWDDTTQANENVPRLNESFPYGSTPYRGVNVGGWLSIEPFITPSLFSVYDESAGVVDEWTLCDHLGAEKAKSVLEKHYSTWVQESTFKEIQEAGFDHIRVPYSYWAVTTYKGDPYVPMVSWRYLLRGIEWARKYGLRVYLDLHAVPGSQNGWNHSGRGSGIIGWLKGADGALNGQRSLHIHNQLSTFFAQPRYKNIVTLYGLVNEPKMSPPSGDYGEDGIPQSTLFEWYGQAIDTIRGNNYTGLMIMGDGLVDLSEWKDSEMQQYDGLVMDTHPYMIFDPNLASMNHYNKIDYACDDWAYKAQSSVDYSRGFGRTMFGEWSQGDTDCSLYVNGVGVGARWDGTFDPDMNPLCAGNLTNTCSCEQANAEPDQWSPDYKRWLLNYAEAQMQSFQYSWGWFYWTWRTESAPQWSYKDGREAGILPEKAYERSWDCGTGVFNFNTSSLPEWY